MSNIETSTETLSADNERIHWIRFIETTGKILAISSSELYELPNTTVVTSSSDICIKARGKSLRSYRMQWDFISEAWGIVDKRNSLILRDNDYPVYEIVDMNPNISDIAVYIYKNTGILEITANYSNIKHSMNLSSINEVVAGDSVLMNLYLTSKNNPDKLYRTIQVDPLELISQGSIRYELGDVTRHIQWKDLAVHTRKIFVNYSITVMDEELQNSHELNNRVIQTANASDGHLVFEWLGSYLNIHSKIDETQQYILSHNKHLKFVVCDSIIDNIVGAFSINVSDILKKRNIKKYLDFPWPSKPVILYRNKQLLVEQKGEQ